MVGIDDSGHAPVSAEFPKVLKTATKAATAERNDGVGASDGPTHAGALQACADNHLATGFDNAGGSAQALRFRG